MDTIGLYKSDGIWMAQHSDPAIKELFNTNTIPTPYRATVPASVVKTEIQALNPERVVSVIGLLQA